MKTMMSILFTLLIINQAALADGNASDYNAYRVKTQVEEYVYEAIVYEPTKEKIKAILLISPTIDGVSSIEESNAQFFSKNGYAVIVTCPYITELNAPHPDMDKLDSDYYRPVVSAISFINLVTVKLKLPENIPVFALGASEGGITTVLITSHIPRITAAWVAVAGGDLPHIYARSEVSQIKKFRENHMRTLGMTDVNEYETYLRGYLHNDPSISCRDIKVPFHQTIALRDTSVPTVTQELLASVCPPHKVLRLNLKHPAGALTTVTMRDEIKEFFESALKQ